MWDAGKMKRVLVFEPGTRVLMNAAPKAVTQTAAASQAKVAAAAAAVTAAPAPAAWLGVARQTLLEERYEAAPVALRGGTSSVCAAASNAAAS